VLGAAAPAAHAGDHKGKVAWAADPTQGFAQARREGKPIMIFFTADW
jgi:thiol:disulfide interchange protein